MALIFNLYFFSGSSIWRPGEAAARRINNVKRTAGICSATIGDDVYEIPAAQRKVQRKNVQVAVSMILKAKFYQKNCFKFQ